MAINLPCLDWHRLRRRTFISLLATVILLPSSANLNAASNTDNAASLTPVIMMLLAEDGPIQLRVGQVNAQGYSSDRYPNGISFEYGRLTGDVRISIDAQDISSGDQVDVLINGVLVGTLSNGRNTFTVPAGNGAKNQIVIRSRTGTGRWAITRLLGLLFNGPQTRAEAQRFLTRATFGPTLTEIDRVIEIGYEAWLDEQIALPATLTIPFYDRAIVDRLANRRRRLISEGVTDPNRLNNPNLGLGQSTSSRLDAWYNAAINGRDQLRQRMAFALSQIWVVGDNFGDGTVSTRSFTDYQDILIRQSLGNYRTLMKDVTLSRAMANWLNLRGNIRSSAPDENYAREIQQLFTIGLLELNMDGSPKRDRNNREIETYTPRTVSEFARVFTGWNWATREDSGLPFLEHELLPLVPWGAPGRFHDDGEKQLHVYPGTNGVNVAGLSHEADLDRALDNLFNHPNVAPFIAKQLIQRLVTSNPSPDYIERVARVFHSNNGVRGDLAATAKAILLDPEALNSHTIENSGKAKEPLMKILQLWRTFNARSAGRYIRFSLPERSTGQRPIGSPTVFNFYPANYAPSGEIENNNLIAPELLLSDGRLQVEFINAIGSASRSKIGQLNPNPLFSEAFTINMVLNLEEAKRRAGRFSSLLDFMNERLFGGLMSVDLRNAVLEYLNDFPFEGSGDARRKQIVEEVLVVLTASPEYSIQR